MKKLICLLSFLSLFFLAAKPALAGVQFSLEPASATLSLEETIQVNIILDTQGNNIGSLSLIISFDPAVVSAGSQLTPGAFSLQLVNTVDNSNGRIRFDAGATTNQNGASITVATINFTGEGVGTTEVTFSEAQAVNADTLEYAEVSSTGGTYEVVAAGEPTPTATPTTGEVEPTATPTPTSGATPTPTPTPQPIPETGIATPTFLLLTSGLVFLTLGIFSFLI